MVYTVEEGQINWYLNGEHIGESTLNTSSPSSGPLLIGNSNPELMDSGVYSGLIDALIIWDKPLSASSISKIHANGILGEPVVQKIVDPKIESISIDQNSIILTVSIENPTGRMRVLSKEELNSSGWEELEEFEVSDIEPGLFEVTFNPPSGDQRFYKILR